MVSIFIDSTLHIWHTPSLNVTIEIKITPVIMSPNVSKSKISHFDVSILRQTGEKYYVLWLYKGHIYGTSLYFSVYFTVSDSIEAMTWSPTSTQKALFHARPYLDMNYLVTNTYQNGDWDTELQHYTTIQRNRMYTYVLEAKSGGIMVRNILTIAKMAVFKCFCWHF